MISIGCIGGIITTIGVSSSVKSYSMYLIGNILVKYSSSNVVLGILMGLF